MFDKGVREGGGAGGEEKRRGEEREGFAKRSCIQLKRTRKE